MINCWSQTILEYQDQKFGKGRPDEMKRIHADHDGKNDNLWPTEGLKGKRKQESQAEVQTLVPQSAIGYRSFHRDQRESSSFHQDGPFRTSGPGTLEWSDSSNLSFVFFSFIFLERYQNELPKRIKQRGKDAHMVHEELVQTMKWKQTRGKYYPQLSYLVKVNTPRAVMQETKKAFRKLPNIEQAITALSNLKGVGTTMASALLAAAAPENAPFMADECLMAIPEIEGIDYTTKEYLNFVTHIQTTVRRLNSENETSAFWSPHRVELALWTHYVASELQPELLKEIPGGGGGGGGGEITKNHVANGINATSLEPSDDSNLEPAASNGTTRGLDSLDESTRSEDSLEKPITPILTNDETNGSDSQSSIKRYVSRSTLPNP
uniref:Uncharacterized protein n=1 Tax=Phlebotomus papatasi TaxID=29031 RepID=A0A1B0DE31_PHLPP